MEPENVDSFDHFVDLVDDQGGGGRTYLTKHDGVFGPLRSLYDFTPVTSAAVVHRPGYCG